MQVLAKYTFLKWKRDKEAIYHIEILPKNTNFKKITKIMNLMPYFSAMHLRHKLFQGQYINVLTIQCHHQYQSAQEQISWTALHSKLFPTNSCLLQPAPTPQILHPCLLKSKNRTISTLCVLSRVKLKLFTDLSNGRKISSTHCLE